MIFRRRRQRILPQINVINMVDVFLLLLIFFMMTTTFITQGGIRINLPKASSKESNSAFESNTIIVSADGKIQFDRKEIRDLQELRSQLLSLNKKRQDDVIIIKADESVAHGIVVKVMDVARTSGFTRIAIATKQ
jgi:biopolymer transport protein ExbD